MHMEKLQSGTYARGAVVGSGKRVGQPEGASGESARMAIGADGGLPQGSSLACAAILMATARP